MRRPISRYKERALNSPVTLDGTNRTRACHGQTEGFSDRSWRYRVLRQQNGDFVPVAVIPAQVNQYNVRVSYSFTADRKVALLAAGDVCHQVDLSLSPDLPVPEAGLPFIRVEALRRRSSPDLQQQQHNDMDSETESAMMATNSAREKHLRL